MSNEAIDTLEFSQRFRAKFGEDAVLLQGVMASSSLSSTLCSKIARNERVSEAELIEQMANVHIVLDQLTVLFSSQIQKYMSRVNEKKKNSLIKMINALDAHDENP